MSRSGKDALSSEPLPPPYTDPYHTSTRGQSILDQLTLTRASHISSTITRHIIPLVEAQASFGIARTTVALLPSDIPLPPVEEKSEFSFDSDDTKPVEVIGFSSEEAPKIVRLEGQMNRTEFWRPQVVIEELERVLSAKLNKSPNLVAPRRSRASEFKIQQAPRRNFLSRLVPSMGPEQRSHSGNPEVGVRPVEGMGMVLVKARLEEISLRTVTEFGLYDTISKQCVIIRVDARC